MIHIAGKSWLDIFDLGLNIFILRKDFTQFIEIGRVFTPNLGFLHGLEQGHRRVGILVHPVGPHRK